MSNWRTVNDRDVKWRKNSGANLANRRTARNCRSSAWKISQHHAAHSLKFPCLPEMHQRAIYLVGLHSRIFQHQNRIPHVELPRCAESSFEQSEAAAQNHSLCRRRRNTLTAALPFAGTQGFRLQSNCPTPGGVADRLQKGMLVVALCSASALPEASGNHRPIKSHPAQPLPEVDLQ